ncbi:4'-phosphopantetheinyl transferase superfamily protein [Flavobacterium sp. j3]|uniref:4'-phosphopantetheinyl transferase superfamily protein n=1 Tax=Flavobacterium aureirubrum TaxID=3133147 RepID=A0ABU9N7F0_9FLAO
MIGNDIVDLKLAHQESNWQRKGFLAKLFTAHEQQLILSSCTPESMVWNLWSRKEAAYKIYNRLSGQRVFNPKSFECMDNKVCFYNTIFYTQTQVTSDFVYTIAATCTSNFDTIQHQTSRNEIHKIKGIPHFFDDRNSLFLPASISHHGRFIRVAVLSLY